jgi:rod shape determining protein RodA
MIIFFAYFFARRHISIGRLTTIIRPFIYFLLPAIFVFLQPDLGTVVVLFGIWLGFLLVSGLRPRHILLGFLILAILLSVGWFTILADYQKERVVALFQPNYDPLGVNYSTIQSKIAIGSGGFFGKGFGQGTQVQLGFLPEAGTDYIFSSLMEEWGLFGGLIALGFFGLVIFRIIKIGLSAEGNFYKFVCLGVVIMFLVQITINLGSALGMLPVIGITFPLLSYGGSSLLINAMLIGIVQSAAVHRSLA